MKRNPWYAVLLAASLLSLAGCGGAAPAATPNATGEPGMTMATGQSMAAGESMAPSSGTQQAGNPEHQASPSASGAAEPSPATQMICAEETKDNITRILALQTPPHSVDSWADQIYTCTYHLSDGPLVLTVKESPDPAAAHTYFDAAQAADAGNQSIDGLTNLGFPAFSNDRGSVTFLKDSTTLTVDASALPAAVGPHAITPKEFAYEVASTVLACWKEHHS
ncbi:MAG: hypothetical protein JWO93_3240 [Micrococcaceae bacterium]|nr:hypothetical protein [Micrococcaceae bacterium]